MKYIKRQLLPPSPDPDPASGGEKKYFVFAEKHIQKIFLTFFSPCLLS